MTAARNVPEKPALEGLEAKWDEIWEANDTYRFDRTATRDQVYSIDTPPPTVSGSLHVGHIFSYTHTDTLARYHRMQGKAGVLPHGLGRQRPSHRAPGAELLRGPLRPVPALRPRLSALLTSPAKTSSPFPGAISSSCASSSPPPTSRPSKSCGAASGCPSTGASPTPPSTSAAAGPPSGRSCATWPGARPTKAKPPACGT